MVCQRCGLKGHNKRTCKEPPLGQNKYEVTINIKYMLQQINAAEKTNNKVRLTIIMLDYLVFNKWFVLEKKNPNSKFRKIIISKLMETEFKDNIDTIYYIKIFNPKVKKIDIKDCPICYNTLSDINVCTTNCGHSFCMNCMIKHLKNKTDCPMCRNYMG